MPEKQDATSRPPAPMANREAGPAPETVSGALPENVGHDPADTNRTLTAAEQRNRDIVAFLNRTIMFEEQSLQVLQDLRNAETDEEARNRLTTFVDENRRSVEVLERAVRDLDGRVNPVRKTSGMLLARARSLVEALPQRARRAMEQRDINAMREEPPFQHMLGYLDAYVAEAAVAAHWDVLKAVADETGKRGLQDAVNESRGNVHAHVDYLKDKLPLAAREAVARANVAQSP